MTWWGDTGSRRHARYSQYASNAVTISQVRLTQKEMENIVRWCAMDRMPLHEQKNIEQFLHHSQRDTPCWHLQWPLPYLFLTILWELLLFLFSLAYVVLLLALPLLRPRSHLLYGEDTAAVRPLNWQKHAAAAEKLRWPQGGPTPFGYILQAVGSPWNYSAEL